MNLNISTKILCVVLAVSLLVMSGWGVVNFLNDKKDLSMDLQQQTEAAAKRLGQALVNPVWNLDDDEIGRIIRYEVNSDNIRAIILRGDNGRLLAGSSKSGGSIYNLSQDNSGKDTAGLLKSTISADAQVRKESAILASVTVYAEDTPLKSKLRKRLFLSAFGILLLCAGLTTVLYMALRRTIVRPLKELEKAVDQISIENLAIPIPVNGTDEIGKLADRFREMTTELQASLDLQRQKEVQLLQAQKMEAVGMLVGGISHDFNNILCAISGSAELLSFRLQAEHLVEMDNIKKHLSNISDATNRATALIRQLLTLSMKKEVLLTAVDLKDSVRHVHKLLQSSLDKSITVKLDLPEMQAMVNSDPIQMEQLLLNLCINASHAMTIMRPEGDPWGGDLGISLKLLSGDGSILKADDEADADACWLLSVTDTGVGMEPSVMENIFTPFFTTKQKGVGSGLGLSMAYSIITQHHGDLTLHSVPGKGSSFHIKLPILCQPDDNRQSAKDAKDTTLPSGSGMILVVDDDDAVRENASQILTQCGYRVVLAGNGAEGVRLAITHGAEIRLILLDMIMPVMSGIDALPKIRESAPAAKLLLTSGFKQDPRVLSLLAKGAVDDFILKPYPLQQLAWRIQALLASDERVSKMAAGQTAPFRGESI
jgi:signal transduction histidine kinase/CheY-like chemotaxis protein